MATKEITNEMYEALKKPLSSDAIKPHPTKSYLSSIKAIYVTERLNEVFGCGAWQLKTEAVSANTETGFVVVKTTLTIPEYGVYYESYGGNDNGGQNSKQFDLGDAYKGATTDGITKIGSYLGIAIDVFKGKVTPPTNNKQSTPQAEPEKKWLNVLDKDKNFTKEWLNVVEGIKKGTIASVGDVRKYYAVSKEVEKSINELIV